MTGSRGGRDLLAAVGVGRAHGRLLRRSGADLRGRLPGAGALMRSWWLVGSVVLFASALSTAVVLDRDGRVVFRGVEPTPDRATAALADAVAG